MEPVLFVIDGERASKLAARYAIDLYRQREIRIYLFNVQPPLGRYITRFFNRKEIGEFQQETGLSRMRSAIDLLEAAGVPYRAIVNVGRKNEEIVRFAKQHYCRQIILAKPRNGFFSRFTLGSTVDQIRQLIGASNRLGIVCKEV